MKQEQEQMKRALEKREQVDKIRTMDDRTIDNIRESLGTLPGSSNPKNYDYVSVYHPDAVGVRITDSTVNPYKNIVRAATATWGDGGIGIGNGPTMKWEKMTPKTRFIVALSALTGNTLPQALETVSYQFEETGPRHMFDQLARARIGWTHASIGCRDNGKLDAPWVLYPDLYNELQRNPEMKENFDKWTKATKDMYEQILSSGPGSYQTARAVLPMSYNHGGVHTTNFLAIQGQCARRLMWCEEAPITLLFWKLRSQIKDRTPLLANYLRPVCDKVNKCVYSGGAEGLTKYFSNLFSGCGRHEDPNDSGYAEFNHSCSDHSEFKQVCLDQGIDWMDKDDWINFTEHDYDLLDPKDKALFEED